ncbi:MAG: hypothetical protein J1E34_02930 [Oscillospiraceae bacterium]|nr:hypothetical protein [Oscillospiraceae bacterium]
MSTGFGLLILAQLALAIFIIWGYMHEERFVAFENKIISKLVSKSARKKLRLIIGGKQKREKDAA